MNKETRKLLDRHFEVAFDSEEGIKKLRELILTLAMQGKLVEQDSRDQPASELLKEIRAEKERLVEEGVIKKGKVLPEVSEGEKSYEIPENWKWVRFQDALDVRDGTHDTPKYTDNGYPLVTSKNLYSGSLSLDNVKYISKEDHLKIIERSKVERGDILFAMIGSIGNPVIVEEDIEFSIKNVALFKYYKEKTINNRFLLSYLIHAQEEMKGKSSGAVQSFVSLGFLRGYLLPLPPLPEQKRIVEKVDQLMQQCDQMEKLRAEREEKRLSTHKVAIKQLLDSATTPNFSTSPNPARDFLFDHFNTLHTTLENVDELRKAILQLAVMGKLVPQDPNDQPASELLNSIKAEKEKLIQEGKIKKQKPLPEIQPDEIPYELPQGWEWVRLQNVIDVRDGTHDSPKDANGPNTYPLITSKNFKNNQIDFSNARRISENDHKEIIKRSFVEKYDILFSMIGGNIGNQVIVMDEIDFSIKNVALFKYYNREFTHPFFIKKFIENLAIGLQEKAAGGAQPFVSLNLLRNILIGLPPINEQKRIVQKTNQLISICDKLEKHTNQVADKKKLLLNAIVSSV